jgi:hypothetical protein
MKIMTKIEPLFLLGEEVETTEYYKNLIDKYIGILGSGMIPYKRGIITDIQLDNSTDQPYLCVTLDNDPNKQVNQIYLQRIEQNPDNAIFEILPTCKINIKKAI